VTQTPIPPTRGLARVVRFLRGLSFQLRYWRGLVADRYLPPIAEALFRAGESSSAIIFRSDTRDLPAVVEGGGTSIDIIDDLIKFTGLSRTVVQANVASHEHISFRSEWYSTPPELRADHWFYLSSKAYLFGNASHFPPGGPVTKLVEELVPRSGLVWDFGAGSGQLTMRLLASGYQVAASELNALQLEFLRFRARLHSPLTDGLSLFHAGDQGGPKECDAVVAVDVLEHLSSPQQTLEDIILPSLNASGILIEDSPFVTNVSNPMHHGDFGFAEFMAGQGFRVVAEGEGVLRAWSRSGAAASSNEPRTGVGTE